MRADTTINARSKEMRTYAPFELGMRGADFGSGANYQQNLTQTSGKLEKLKQAAPIVDITDFDSLEYITEYITSTGEKQKVCFGYVGSNIKLRSVKEDDTILTPTGGLGDVTFTGTVSARQVGSVLIIGDSAGAYSWNGTLLATVAGSGSISVARDGSRLAYIDTDGKAKFTDNDPAGGFTGGTGANAAGDYNTSIPVATATIEGGVGVIIWGEREAEAHWVQPNSASDEVTSRTKIESFSYIGKGVTSERFLASTGSAIAFMNEDGVFLMDSFSGQATNLIIGGKIERYWKEQVDMTNGFVTYNNELDIVIAQVALDSPQNNVFIAFNLREKNKPPLIVNEQYLNCAGNVGGSLVGGSNASGDITALFNAYALTSGLTSKSRYITEFDGMGSLQTDKNLQSVTAIVDVSPDANLTLRAYFDGETSPSVSKTITTADLTTPDAGAAYGEYVFAIGASDLVQEGVLRGEKFKTGMRFKTIAIELVEESSANFKIYDIIVLYKTSGRMSHTMSLKNNLF